MSNYDLRIRRKRKLYQHDNQGIDSINNIGNISMRYLALTTGKHYLLSLALTYLCAHIDNIYYIFSLLGWTYSWCQTKRKTSLWWPYMLNMDCFFGTISSMDEWGRNLVRRWLHHPSTGYDVIYCYHYLIFKLKWWNELWSGKLIFQLIHAAPLQSDPLFSAW